MRIMPLFASVEFRVALDHVWQSTIVALLALLLALTFRRYGATVRHAIVSAALLKFLVPFAALAALGAVLAPSLPSSTPPGGTVLMLIAQPLISAPLVSGSPADGASRDTGSNRSTLAYVGWALGAALVFGRSATQWRRTRRVARRGIPIVSGRARDAMSAVAAATGLRAIPMVATQEITAPGVFGIRRPVLLWPSGISAGLTDEELSAVIAHELLHVRRRDNLVMALQVCALALFWFHPLVWYLAARAAREREYACDEAVLQLGAPPAVYAASILNACRFHIQARPACVAGVSGSDLSRRIRRIMEHTTPRALRRWHEVLLASVVSLAIAVPVTLGVIGAATVHAQSVQLLGSDADRPAGAITIAAARNPGGPFVQYFRSGDIFQPGGRWIASNVTFRQLMAMAYGIPEFRVMDGPEWLVSATFDVTLTPPGNPPDGNGDGRPPSEVLEGLRHMLNTHYGVVAHLETRHLPRYVLTVAPGGLTARPRSTERCVPRFDAGCGLTSRPGHLDARGIASAELAAGLSALPVVGRDVADRTGLQGLFDVNVSWTPHVPMPSMRTDGPVFDRPVDTTSRSLRAALVSQLGLELVEESGPVVVLVVDHILSPVPERQAAR